MRVRRIAFAWLVAAGVAGSSFDVAKAQAPAKAAPAKQAPAKAAPVKSGAPSTGGRATLAQIMRAIPFPNSNIIFDVQDNDPAKKKPDPNGPYIGQYQGWEGVENAGLAIAEFATLLLQPGRMCSNGKPVPVREPDFVQMANDLKTIGMQEYNAARTKKVDTVNNLSDKLTESCSNCHDKYRPDSRLSGPKIGPEKRCTPGL